MKLINNTKTIRKLAVTLVRQDLRANRRFLVKAITAEYYPPFRTFKGVQLLITPTLAIVFSWEIDDEQGLEKAARARVIEKDPSKLGKWSSHEERESAP